MSKLEPGIDLDNLVHVHVFGKDIQPLHENIPLRFRLPHYSTSIQDAWLVVEKIKDKGWASVIVNGIAENHTIAQLYNAFDHKHQEQGKDAQHAICLAALKAVGFEMEE